jgi:hypothetical protein
MKSGLQKLWILQYILSRQAYDEMYTVSQKSK